MNFSCCSFNVRGLGSKSKQEQIFAWLKSSNLTLCMLQETHSGENTQTSWKQEWGNDAFWSELSNNSEGIGILINPKVSYIIQKYTDLIPGRMQALELIIIDKEIYFINIYGPNNDDCNFFE